MGYDNEKLNKIFDKTDGCCHICHKKLAFSNYGSYGSRGAWHVDHSKAKANGGTNHVNNLFPACVKCNLDKSTYHAKTARSWNNKSRAPYAAKKKQELKEVNTITAVTLCAIAGSAFGPVGTLVGGAIGGIIGNEISPKR
ncbi:MAG: hypothetical protein BGO69_17180 [Bacteroidetes bacterium 46-16]|nr:MAG: hypothetical protein BGO69_17180 [Bacteroidetes bacterium 46-16]